MASTKELRERIRSVITTQQMTRAMKMVAAAKLGRAQKNIERLRPYALKLQEIMGNIASNVSGEINSPYLEERNPENVLIVVVTSNRGLCGAFNANVCKMAMGLVRGQYAEQYKSGKVSMLCAGRKGFEFFKKRGFNMIGENHDLFSDLTFDNVNEVAVKVLDGFVDRKWDRVVLVYNEFKNVMTQETCNEQFLPVVQNTTTAKESSASSSDYIYEPDQTEILTSLIPKSLKTQFYKALLESNAGEQGSRMVAMDNATENAEELLKSLRLQYNQARQAAITTEILEIVAGAEALASAS